MTSIIEETTPQPSAPSKGFLDVRDLRVHFPTDDGLVKSVDGLSFHVERGKTLGIVGESGSGKSVTSMSVMGLHKAGSANITGQILLDGKDLVASSPEEVRLLRGKRMAMIFQDPLSAMHPYYTVGNQIVEAYRVHNDVSKAEAREHAIEMLDRVGHPRAQPARRRLPAPVLRRHAAARDDRDGAVVRPGAADRRRADHRPRRDRAGADPGPDP